MKVGKGVAKMRPSCKKKQGQLLHRQELAFQAEVESPLVFDLPAFAAATVRVAICCSWSIDPRVNHWFWSCSRGSYYRIVLGSIEGWHLAGSCNSFDHFGTVLPLWQGWMCSPRTTSAASFV